MNFTSMIYFSLFSCKRVTIRIRKLLPNSLKNSEGDIQSLSILVTINSAVVREVNVRVLGMEMQCAYGGRFEINQLLFADDTALVADSEDKFVDW